MLFRSLWWSKMPTWLRPLGLAWMRRGGDRCGSLRHRGGEPNAIGLKGMLFCPFEPFQLNLDQFNVSFEPLLPVSLFLAPHFILKLLASINSTCPWLWPWYYSTSPVLSYWMNLFDPLLPVALVKDVKILSMDPLVALDLNKKYQPYLMPPHWLALAVFKIGRAHV